MIQVKKGENGFLGRNIPDTNVCHSVVCSETMSYFLLVGPGVQGVQWQEIELKRWMRPVTQEP